jgi:hypothetical protein
MRREWQVKQIVTVGTKQHVDNCNCFGDRSSYKVFISFSLLIVWIVKVVIMICNLKAYIDDNASFGCTGDILYYEPYKCYFPTGQTKLLKLWDELNIPHKEKKQIYGPIIPFMGFNANPNDMTVSMSDKHQTMLLVRIRDFLKPGKWHSLKDFQSIAGYINWSFVVFLLLKPSLSTLYAKTTVKTQSHLPVHVNNTICKELMWFTKHASASNGIFLLKSVAWDPTTNLVNTTVCYADACLGGMAFWYPELKLGYQSHIPTDTAIPIFYWEAVAVACTMTSTVAPDSSCLVVYTDNTNTADIWHCLKASAPYITTLVLAIDWIIEHSLDA